MAGVQEESVARFPFRSQRIVVQILRVKDIDEISSSHSPSRMTGFGFLYGCYCQQSDIVSCTLEETC